MIVAAGRGRIREGQGRGRWLWLRLQLLAYLLLPQALLAPPPSYPLGTSAPLLLLMAWFALLSGLPALHLLSGLPALQSLHPVKQKAPVI